MRRSWGGVMHGVFLMAGTFMAEAGPARERVVEAFRGQEASLHQLYRELHAAPELSWQEVETARRLATEFRAAGMDVTTGVGTHGVVGVLRNGAGPTILVRCDLDGLPIKEETGLAFASTRRAPDGRGGETGGCMRAGMTCT